MSTLNNGTVRNLQRQKRKLVDERAALMSKCALLTRKIDAARLIFQHLTARQATDVLALAEGERDDGLIVRHL